MNFSRPVVGQWYTSRETGRVFEIVSMDDDGTIELQDYDGNLDEIERAAWLALDVDAIDPPEDIAGIFDLDDLDEADGADIVASRDYFESMPTLRGTWHNGSND